MRLYLIEIKKLVSPPFLVIFLMLFVGINILFMSTDGLDTEQSVEISKIVNLRRDKHIKTFGDAGNYSADFENIFSGGELEDKSLSTKDIGLGKNTVFYFSLLTKTVFSMLFAENALICIFLVVFTFGMENVSDMEQMLYSAKTGTRIALHKLAAVISIATISNILLSALTLVAFTVKTGLPVIWEIKMNCPYLHGALFNMKPYRPILNMTLLEYTLIILFMLLSIAVIFAIFIFAVMYLFQGTLTGAGACLMLLLTDYVASYFWISKYPTHLWQGSFSSLYLTMQLWLTDLHGAYIIRHQDIIAIPALMLIAVLILTISLIRLKKKR